MQPCGVHEARAKLQRAEKFLEAARFITDEPEPDADFVSAAAARRSAGARGVTITTTRRSCSRR